MCKSLKTPVQKRKKREKARQDRKSMRWEGQEEKPGGERKRSGARGRQEREERAEARAWGGRQGAGVGGGGGMFPVTHPRASLRLGRPHPSVPASEDLPRRYDFSVC